MFLALALTGPVYAQHATPAGSEAESRAQPSTKRMVTQGLATTVIGNLFKCQAKVANHRVSAVGTITATDGTVLTVPAATQYQTGPKIPDLYNECSNVTPQRLADTQAQDVPVVEIDPDGEVVTGSIVADNYFELYVDGTLIGVDAVPYTPSTPGS